MEVINSSISPQCAEGHSEIHSCQSVNPTPGGPHVTSDTSSATRNHNSNSNNEINEHGKRALNDPNDHNPQPPKRQRTESHHQELLYTTPEFIRAICEGGKIDESLLLRIQSKHTKYNSARPWKLFFKDDPMLYHDMNRENRTCALCDMSFANSNGWSSHPLSKKQHQLNLIKYCIENDMEFAEHIYFDYDHSTPNLSTLQTPTRSKTKTLFSFNFKSKSNGSKSNSNTSSKVIPMTRSTLATPQMQCLSIRTPIRTPVTKSNAPNSVAASKPTHRTSHRSSAPQIEGMLSNASKCKGHCVPDLFNKAPPYLFTKYNLQCVGDSLHDPKCLLYVNSSNRRRLSKQCAALFTKAMTSELSKVIATANKIDCVSKYLAGDKAKFNRYELISSDTKVILLRSKNVQLEKSHLSSMNSNRKLLTMQKRDYAMNQLLSVVSSGNILGVGSIIKSHLDANRSIHVIVAKLQEVSSKLAANPLTKIELSKTILAAGGPTLLYLLNKLNVTFGVSKTRTAFAEAEPPVMTHVISHQDILLSLARHKSMKGKYQGLNASIDFVYGDELISSHNENQRRMPNGMLMRRMRSHKAQIMQIRIPSRKWMLAVMMLMRSHKTQTMQRTPSRMWMIRSRMWMIRQCIIMRWTRRTKMRKKMMMLHYGRPRGRRR
eukprot:747474_1